MTEHEQGTVAWLQARAGHCTASRFADVLAKVRAGEAATRRDYRWQLVTERITGQPCRQYESAAMRRGKELEPHARMAYEAETGNLVDEVGFILHPVVTWAGCSPDGLIGDDGGVEIKCPDNPVIHVQTLSGGMPTEHLPQVQGCMWITGRSWWDFASYHPDMPDERMRLYVERITRDEAYMTALNDEVHAFLAEVDKQHKGILLMRAAA